jgi:hypothetical protein
MKNFGRVLAAVVLGTVAGVQTGCSVKAGSDDPLSELKRAPVSQSSLVGRWQSNCYAQNGVYLKEDMTLDQSQFSNHISTFYDAACARPLHGGDIALAGTFLVEGASTVSNAVNLKMTFNSGPDAGHPEYGIALIEGANLYLSYMVSNPASRPSSVNRTVVYSRVAAVTPTPTPAPTPAASSVPASLIGVWSAACVSNSHQYQQRVVTITATSFEDKTTAYTDQNCTRSAGFSMTQASGPLTYQGTDPGLPSTYDIAVTDKYASGAGMMYNIVQIQNGVLYLGAYWSQDSALRSRSVDQSTAFRK